MAEPWSQSLLLRWRPNLAFFERRIEILRFLEKQDRLSAFKVEDRAVQADIASNLTLEITAVGCTLHTIGAENGDGMEIISLMLDELAPHDIQVHSTLQYVAGVDASYEDARLRLSTWITRGLLAASSTAIDSAPLIDGVSGTLQAGFQTEFGIVNPEETLPRLNRTHGRLNHPDDAWYRLVNRVITDPRDFPQCSVFSEWRWTAMDPDWDAATGKFVESLERWSIGLRSEGSELVERVKALVQSADPNWDGNNHEHEAV